MALLSKCNFQATVGGQLHEAKKQKETLRLWDVPLSIQQGGEEEKNQLANALNKHVGTLKQKKAKLKTESVMKDKESVKGPHCDDKLSRKQARQKHKELRYKTKMREKIDAVGVTIFLHESDSLNF